MFLVSDKQIESTELKNKEIEPEELNSSKYIICSHLYGKETLSPDIEENELGNIGDETDFEDSKKLLLLK